MSRRKGLSHEEKRSKLLELLYERKDFFMLKELEKMAPKEKGVIAQAVKDVLQSLVDDGLVDTDKIGTCVYFWAFPSKASGLQINRRQEQQDKLAAAEQRLADVQHRILAGQEGREETDARAAALASLQDGQQQQALLQKQLQQYADSDPETLRGMVEETKVATAAANRWTDNLAAVKSWCKNKFYLEEDLINRQFGIPDDLDYLD